MNRLSSLSISLLVTLGVVTLLSGCTATFVFPATSSVATQVSQGGIQGDIFGGHAPIVGAHVFLLQATAATTGTGYGQKATSLLQANPGGTTLGGSPTLVDSSGSAATNPTFGMTYVTTNNRGYFNITSEYSCTEGLPVYIYAPGGTSAQLPSTTITAGTVGSNSATFTANNLFSVGQYVTFANFLSTAGIGLNSSINAVGGSGVNDFTASYLVTAASLTSFTVTGSGPFSFLLTGNTGPGVALPTLPSNPATANMAVLGNCSSSHNFSNLTYIFLNEVSTVATAYALGGFFTNTTTGLSSTDAVHLSIPLEAGFAGVADGTSPAWIGIENAANNADLMYNVQGLGNLSPTNDGEGHIANATTPSGLGTVPQALIDGIANSLAACVDSGNTATLATAPCTTLLGAALPSTSSAGTPSGTAPKDTATAAINLAHNPWTNQTSTIYNLAGSLVPYAPTLASAPGDFAVGIRYQLNTAGTDLHGSGSVAIDSGGNAWVTSFDSANLKKLSPTGTQLFSYSFPPDAQGNVLTPGDIAIDSNSRAWVAFRNQDGTICSPTSTTCLTTDKTKDSWVGAYLFTSAGSLVSGSPFAQNNAAAGYDQLLTDNLTVAVDGNDNAYFANHLFSNALVLNSSGSVLKSFGNPSNSSPISTYGGPFGVALDATGNLWMSSNIGSVNNPINNVTYWDTAASSSTQLKTINFTNSEGIAIDAGANVWVADAGTTKLFEIKSGTTTATPYNGGGINAPVKVAVDGSGLVFASSPTGGAGSHGNLAVFDNSGTALSGSGGVTGTFVTGSTTVRQLNQPYFLAIDNTGDVWVSTSTGVTEYIGIATPVLTPLSAAVKKGTIAARP
jgi:hypothetical protein